MFVSKTSERISIRITLALVAAIACADQSAVFAQGPPSNFNNNATSYEKTAIPKVARRVIQPATEMLQPLNYALPSRSIPPAGKPISQAKPYEGLKPIFVTPEMRAKQGIPVGASPATPQNGQPSRNFQLQPIAVERPFQQHPMVQQQAQQPTMTHQPTVPQQRTAVQSPTMAQQRPFAQSKPPEMRPQRIPEQRRVTQSQPNAEATSQIAPTAVRKPVKRVASRPSASIPSKENTHTDLGTLSEPPSVPTISGEVVTSRKTSTSVSHQVSLVVRGPQSVSVGQRIRYEAIVENKSLDDVSDIEVSYTSSGTVLKPNSPTTVKAGTIGPGEIKKINFYMLARQEGSTSPAFSLTSARSKSDSTQSDNEIPMLVVQSETAETLKVTRRLVKTTIGGPALLQTGTEATYSIDVANVSEELASSIVVQLQLPAGINVTVLDRQAWFDEKKNSLTWELDSLDPGKREKIQFKAKADRFGRKNLRVATGVGSQFQGIANMNTNVISLEDLDVRLNHTAPSTPGVESIVTVQVSNTSIGALEDIQLNVTLPQGIRVAQSALYEVVGDSIMFKPFTLENSQQRTFKFGVILMTPGTKTFNATASSGSNRSTATDSNTVVIGLPQKATTTINQVAETPRATAPAAKSKPIEAPQTNELGEVSVLENQAPNKPRYFQQKSTPMNVTESAAQLGELEEVLIVDPSRPLYGSPAKVAEQPGRVFK